MVALGAAYAGATMHDVNTAVIQPRCEEHGQCYAHAVNGNDLLHVTVFVSHAWSEAYEQFFESVDGTFRHWAVKPNLWICATALLQSRDPAKVALQVGTGGDPSNAPFTQALRAAEKMLVVRNDNVDLYDRIWCCWELFIGHQQGLIQRPGALLVSGPPAVGGGRRADVAAAEASNSEDKRRILLHILKNPGGYDVVNNTLEAIREFNV